MARQHRKGRRVPDIGRPTGTRSPKKRFLLFCEGKTEKCYFDALNRIVRDALIEVVSDPVGGAPRTIADKAIRKTRERRRKDSYEENDEIWAVFDRDTHPRYEDSIQRCEIAGVGVARSNPCFELWLVLHFESFDRPCTSAEIQQHLRTHIPEYHPTSNKTVDCAALMERIDPAENRGQRQFDARQQERQGSLGPPYTTVWRLTRAVRKAADE